MATAEKTQEQQKQFHVPDDAEYSSGDEDYDSADDYDEEEEVPQKNNRQRRRRPLQKAPKDEEVYSDDDYASDEYDDDDYYSDEDDDMVQGKAMQPYSQQGNMDMSQPTGGMNFAPRPEQKSILDEEGMKLKLELNLEIEIELKARIHGDLTIALM
ncbi:hypothetical protein N7510_010802 [Penicillium lagena]|uniref:uncharacterized protein n=1 Tax=Penicillium lagena TaxID=94218 RepID=UPI00253F6D07|nr:uncharacterized protein N7510_010802 [Penicillium lagena]KAJ5601268.1 hypothetical protein N7510_010802 [Penicillium lagena]